VSSSFHLFLIYDTGLPRGPNPDRQLPAQVNGIQDRLQLEHGFADTPPLRHWQRLPMP